MNIFYNFRISLLTISLLTTFSFFANNPNNAIDLCSAQTAHNSLLDFFLINDIVYDGVTLTVNSAMISEVGEGNPFSNNHYEYFITLSDGVYNGGDEYTGGTYSLNIELLSLGNSFVYGNFPSCFLCDNTTDFSFTGHVFLIEDTNDDDILDFNTDPTNNGTSGSVTFTQNNDIRSLEIDFVMEDGKELNGCHSGEFPIDPVLDIEDFSSSNISAIKIHNNPVQDFITFEVELQKSEAYNFYIYNSEGVLLINDTSNKTYQEVDIRNFPSGIYFLSFFERNKKIVSKKIIVK